LGAAFGAFAALTAVCARFGVEGVDSDLGAATEASWLRYFRALKLGAAARGAPIDKLSVVLVALFGAVFLGERLLAVNWLGVAMVAGGAMLVAFR
jgi:transporter family protein